MLIFHKKKTEGSIVVAMEATSVQNQFYLNNCKKIFNKFVETQANSCDVSLAGGSGTFIRCHQFVLSACSPFFEKVFQNYNQHKTCQNSGDVVLLLGGHTAQNIQSIVDYIYHGRLPDLGTNNEFDDTHESLIRLANELQVSGFSESLLEKQRNAKVHLVNENSVCVTNGHTSSDDESSSQSSSKSHALETEQEFTITAEDILKSSGNYDHWLRRLTNVRKRQATKNKTIQDKCPQELLNDLIEGVKFCFPPYKDGIIRCVAEINGQQFTGVGLSCQTAKLHTIKLILEKIFNIVYDKLAPIPRGISSNSSEQFANTVERLILDKYNEIMSRGKNGDYYVYKVIAGVVESDDNNPGKLKVVSIGTGSKFLHNRYICITGDTVHDTHAEVAARRGLMKYFYYEAQQCICNSSKLLFEKSNKSLKLKSSIKFHLYVSTAPCGDARIYSHGNGRPPLNNQTSKNTEGQLKRKDQGALTPSKDPNPDKANFMSCSAKMLKWNILGIQGALLSKIIEPVYLSSIILGEKFVVKHMERAMYGRVEQFNLKLLKVFNKRKPNLMQVSETKAKPGSFSPNHSVNWNFQHNCVEIIESTSGRKMGGDNTNNFSRISKRALFKDYHKIAKKLNQKHSNVYSQAKAGAQDYQAAKSILFEAFKDNGVGPWVEKCQDVNAFAIFF